MVKLVVLEILQEHPLVAEYLRFPVLPRLTFPDPVVIRLVALEHVEPEPV
jgi:hypothetical protein